MRNANLSVNISKLRKGKGITQEQLAAALNISSQAVSKWETGVSQPDTMTLPLIADYFGVSIDYLFYVQELTYDELYMAVFKKVAGHPQMCKESYEDALKIFGHVHHGISCGNLFGKSGIIETPVQLSNDHGVSLLSGKGYGAILTRSFFQSISRETAESALPLLSALADLDRLFVCMAMLSMHDISYGELKEKLGFSDDVLRRALDRLIADQIVNEKVSKHKSLGYTYEIRLEYHTCLCILLATLEMQRLIWIDHSCCMGYGDYPIQL